ncbi:hypothetical protein TNCV_3145191 [Trichonephila clavipes]|nr:hypothetical protein TNCV_3145191 [Trichonephila clavipes]
MREYRKNEREVTSEQKIELAKTQLAKLEKEIELQLAKNKALSLNPAAKVEEKQFETNIEKYDKKFSSGLHGSTAADSVRSEWPLWHAAKSKHSLRAQAHLSKSRTETVETGT